MTHRLTSPLTVNDVTVLLGSPVAQDAGYQSQAFGITYEDIADVLIDNDAQLHNALRAYDDAHDLAQDIMARWGKDKHDRVAAAALDADIAGVDDDEALDRQTDVAREEIRAMLVEQRILEA